MKCLKCGKDNNDTAKFCRYCGEKLGAADGVKPGTEKKKKCPQCGADVKTGAKFCNSCGYRFEGGANLEANRSASIDVENNYITWRILPGQLAVKIDEKDIAGYGTVKGLYITPGTTALLFVNGNHVATLESGKYPFSQIAKEEDHKTREEKPEKKKGRVLTFFRNLAGRIANGIDRLFGRSNGGRGSDGVKRFYTVVLVRGTQFPLLFDVKDVPTRNIRCEVGLHVLCSITDVNAFFEHCLVDKKYASFEELSNTLFPTVKDVLGVSLGSVTPDDVTNNPDLTEQVRAALDTRFAQVLGYCHVNNIISLSSKQEDLENIRVLQEDLYIAERELEQAQLRADFLNKMQGLEYSNALRSARAETDYIALMDAIDEDRMLNEDKKAQFALMLQSQRLLREATTQTETENALDGLKRSRMLSLEEIEALKVEIQHKRTMTGLSNAQEIAMTTLLNEKELDKEKLNWEIEIGHKREMTNLLHDKEMDRERLDWELDIGNKRFYNQLERDRAEEAFARERQESDYSFKRREMSDKMDLLRQASAIREEREAAEHKRRMEERALDYESEANKLKINSTMTFEQIVAANPNVSPEVARALAEKFKADAESNKNEREMELMRANAELQKEHGQDLKEILFAQMQLNKDVTNLQMNHTNTLYAEKQGELDRVHTDAERHQDRMLDAVETTVSAVAAGKNTQSSSGTPAPVATTFCPNCGTKNPVGTKNCTFCGEELE